MPDRVVVIGGGAAGLMAAGRAAECSASVLLLEKTERLGQKLRLTGGGHGNVTHTGDLRAFLSHLHPNSAFMRQALRRFSPQNLISFLESHDLPLMTDAEGRVFPASRNAHDIVSTLRAWCLDNRVQFRFRSPVQEILTRDDVVYAVRVGDKTIAATSAVLATGGASYPQTGSTGDGYRLAQALGHSVTPLRPGLAPLVLQESWCRALQGVTVHDIAGWLERDSARLALAKGALLWTHFGASGPLALSLSSFLGSALTSGTVKLCLDLAPQHSREALDARLRGGAFSQRATVGGVLREVTPRALAEAILAQGGVPFDQPLSQLTAATRRKVVDWLKRCELTVIDTWPLERATITLGGVSCDEIDPCTMASHRVKGLFLAGEVLDVSGDTGGYNLQIAFSSGYVAGESAARFRPSQGK